jgi:hypothetical protein
MDKAISLKQLAANGRNAQKSTGPKTPQGLAVSKMNAVTHGIWSKEVLVRGLNIKESRSELEALFEEFRESLNPVGPVEAMLVDQIVTTQWRLRRVLRAESGEIALSVDDGQWKRGNSSQVELQMLYWDACGEPICHMKDSVIGNAILAGWLREVRARVEQEGELTEAAAKIPRHGKPNILSVE